MFSSTQCHPCCLSVRDFLQNFAWPAFESSEALDLEQLVLDGYMTPERKRACWSGEQVPQIKAAVRKLLDAIQIVTETAQSCQAEAGNEASASSDAPPSHTSSSKVATKLAEAHHAADLCSEWADKIEVSSAFSIATSGMHGSILCLHKLCLFAIQLI